MWLTSNKPTRVAHGVVFVEDAGILDRHVPAAEIDHFGAQRAMDGVQAVAFRAAVAGIKLVL